MGSGYYILNEDKSISPVDLRTWATWIEENPEQKRIAKDEVSDYLVSTVFLGLDHQWGEGPPVVFETMIFQPDKTGFDDLYCCRYSTYEEALETHKKITEGVEDFLNEQNLAQEESTE